MDEELLRQAAAILRQGGLVGMPTETVYGLAADATDPVAVARIFKAKGRPRFDPLIVHIADPADLDQVGEPSPADRVLAERFWPGPLTLIMPRKPCIPEVVTSGLPNVAVRCPDHRLARALIRAAGRPLAAPSANRFGSISPTTAAAVRQELGAQVDLILDGGTCRVGVESSVVRTWPSPVLLRPGGIAREDLAAVLRMPVALADDEARLASLPAESPGRLPRHYAPRIPVRLKVPAQAWTPGPQVARLAFQGHDLPADGVNLVLSRSGDLIEAAAHLFAGLRLLDGSGCQVIEVETVPETGLGLAINDRLRRAAAAEP